MNFVQQLEECLRDLAAEARKNHPGVKEASERATLKLRTLQNSYVSAVRQATSSGKEHPTTKLFQSSDLLHPFLLAANYPNATNALLEISFRAMKLLMEADAVVPSDGLNMVRVWVIQAHVVTAYYQKQFAKELKSMHSEGNKSVAEDNAIPTSSSATATSSWFSWGSSSATTTTTTSDVPSSTSSNETASKLSVKNAVSSSSGQTGQGSFSPIAMEKLALEILSCLLQLVERLKGYPESLTPELWTNAMSLACLWLYNTPNRHKVQQAAQSTTVQFLELLYQINGGGKMASMNKLALNTWQDLLALAMPYPKKLSLTGAFSLCRRAPGTAVANPPSPEFALELMTHVWKDGKFRPDDALLMKTFSLTMALLEQISKLSVERTLRTLQWSSILFQRESAAFPNECREIFARIIKPIVSATDACRSHHDFEDGYVYTSKEASLEDTSEILSTDRDVKRRSENLASFFPRPVLWKASFSLEVVYIALDKENDETCVLFDDPKLVAQIAEALSHFATIGASCRDHMLQIVDFCQFQLVTNQKPTAMRKAETAILSGNVSLFATGAQSKATEKNNGNSSSILGESLFFSLQSMLRIAYCLRDMRNADKVLEESFAPFLAILQHFMKRFTGSPSLVNMALGGYIFLSDTSLPLENNLMQRKALLTSVSKLSLPSWGKHDPSTQLGAHHIRAIVCLLKIVHMHFDLILSDWDLILWTFEELSIIPVASPLLSDEDYHAALSIAAVYCRFAPFSTCFGDDSVLKMVETLADICESSMRDRDIVGDSETVLPEIFYSGENPDKASDGRGESIGGKIMSMGVKALYGNSTDETGKAENNAPHVRTKNVFYEEYRQFFVQRLSSSKHTVRMNSLGRVPFVLMLLTDVTIANSFRSKECLEVLFMQLSKLAVSTPAVRPFVMDVMTLLIMTQLSDDESSPVKSLGPGKVLFRDPMLSQLLASERTDTNPGPCHEVSHVDILSPLCETIRSSERADITESALGILSIILQGSGHLLQPMAWSLILGTVSSVSGDPALLERRSSAAWATCCQMGFRCFKLIIDDFLDELPSSQDGNSNREDILECCSSFVRSRHDVNTSLTAIGLLWTVADQDSNSESVDLALRTLVLLSSDDRVEVRNAAVNTLFSCIIGKGSGFSAERWRSCFDETICGVYEVVASHFRSQTSVESESRASASATPSKQSRYRVILHSSRDSASKQWIATQVLVLRGLIRVLRSFFKELLDTTDSGINEPNTSPWFQETWVRVLDFAWEAVTQEGDRESLDIRSVGAELLGIATQLTSSAGIQASVTPARVTTSMEVVNGALRSVRESTSKATIKHSHSMATNLIRQKLFLEAFESLESFQEVVSSKINEADFPTDVDLQVLHRFASSLSKVYDCCKADELKSETPLITSLNINMESDVEVTLEARFVILVSSLLKSSSKSHQVKYLNQPQRCCMDLLRNMARQGSFRSFEALVSIARGSFFVRKDQDVDESEVGEDFDSTTTYSLLSHEAAAVVSEEVVKEPISNECKVLVLELVFSEFFKEFGSADASWQKRYYKHFIPVLQCGLSCSPNLLEEHASETKSRVWQYFASFLSRAFSLVQLGRNMTKIPRVNELIEIIEASMPYIPCESTGTVSEALEVGLLNSFVAAKQHAAFAVEHISSEIGRKSGRHRDELLSLFKLTLEHCCILVPEQSKIRQISLEALSGALSSKPDDPAKDVLVAASQAVCEILQKYERMQMVVVSLFPILSQFTGSDLGELKETALSLFRAVDVPDLLERAETRYTTAENRANAAENEVEKLKSIVKDLTRANEKLRHDVAVLEASTALHT